MTILQNGIEFEWFADILRREGVRSYLEIGSKWGGSLLGVAKALPVPSRLVSIDFGTRAGFMRSELEECVQTIREMGHDVTALVGDSIDPMVVNAAQKLGPVDACFIDGNHTLPYLERDFANYGSVSEIVAFHDIGWQPKSDGPIIEVPQFWRSIKGRYRHNECSLNKRSNGIGVLWTERKLISSVAPYTKTSTERCAAMITALRKIDAEHIEGAVVECGVWRGGNIILARTISPTRVCWLYDTFTGMTKPGPEDKTQSGYLALSRYRSRQAAGLKGWCAASVYEVKGCLIETETFDEDRIRFVVGDVAQTLHDPINLPEQIALLRLDTDWYESTKVELEVLYPRLAPGGILIIDDYGHWRGARKAVDEYFAGHDVTFVKIDYTAMMVVKPC